MIKYQRPRGTKDVLPRDMPKWHYVERTIREVMDLYNFSEIRTPAFEFSELFTRGVGENTDIVNKEMYTFLDKGGNMLTLKPEMTAPVVRAYLENGLAGESPDLIPANCRASAMLAFIDSPNSESEGSCGSSFSQ